METLGTKLPPPILKKQEFRAEIFAEAAERATWPWLHFAQDDREHHQESAPHCITQNGISMKQISQQNYKKRKNETNETT